MDSKGFSGAVSVIFTVLTATSIILMPHANALEENGVIEMPYTESIPTIDGKWTTTEEWNDAYLHTDSTSGGETFYVLAKHDRDFLYIMFDRIELEALNTIEQSLRVIPGKDTNVDDYVIVCFDTNNDGGYEKNNDDFCFTSFAIDSNGKVTGDIIRTEDDKLLCLPSGTSGKVSLSSENDPYESGRDHLIYEMRVPISFLHANDVYGFQYSMWDQHSPSFRQHTWPDGAKEPQTWGALVDPENKVTAPPVPFLSISTKEIDFGSTAVSESSQRGVTVSNKGTAVLLINSVTSSGNFAVRGIDTPTEIQPNESVSFDVNFSPLSLGSKTGSITIKTNDLSSKTVVIQTSGQGTEKGAIGGGGCLIATATFGSELSPQVQQLREIRDNAILQTESGTSFMTGFSEFYYSFSPAIADLERESPAFKELVKVAITPMLSTLSILNYVNIDSEADMLGYGIGIITLNVGMYFGLPVVAIVGLRRHFQKF